MPQGGQPGVKQPRKADGMDGEYPMSRVEAQRLADRIEEATDCTAVVMAFEDKDGKKSEDCFYITAYGPDGWDVAVPECVEDVEHFLARYPPRNRTVPWWLVDSNAWEDYLAAEQEIRSKRTQSNT